MSPASKNSFGARETLQVDGKGYEIFRLRALENKGVGHAGKLPFSLRVLLENLLRQEDDRFVHAKDIEALASWDPNAATQKEISFMPARVLLQDFTGVPCVVDLAAMREAVSKLGGDPKKVNPLLPAELVIDHSVQVDKAGSDLAFAFNAELEFHRNVERDRQNKAELEAVGWRVIIVWECQLDKPAALAAHLAKSLGPTRFVYRREGAARMIKNRKVREKTRVRAKA